MSELENEPGCHNCVHLSTSIADEPCRTCLAAVPTKGWNTEYTRNTHMAMPQDRFVLTERPLRRLSP